MKKSKRYEIIKKSIEIRDIFVNQFLYDMMMEIDRQIMDSFYNIEPDIAEPEVLPIIKPTIEPGEGSPWKIDYPETYPEIQPKAFKN